MTSSGPYGVYHSVFDDLNWFEKFGDPTFVYEQEMARVFGLEALHMAEADVLPYDYELYGKISVRIWSRSQVKARETLGADAPDFSQASHRSERFTAAGTRVWRFRRIPRRIRAS